MAAVSARTMNGSGCPYCAGRKVLAGFNDLATREPEIAKQWHPTLNGTLTPQMVTVGSHKKAWWAVPRGARVEGGGLRPGGAGQVGLPRVRGQGPLCAAGPVPEPAGGGEKQWRRSRVEIDQNILRRDI